MYKTAWFCVSCNGEVSYGQKMHSHGRCPLCGYKGEKACTILETYEVAYIRKRIPSGSWWKRDTFIREFLWEGKNEA